MPAKKQKCRHNWKILALGTIPVMTCVKCRERHNVTLDKKTANLVAKWWKQEQIFTNKLHRNWHSFEKKFKDLTTNEWKLHGWKLMEAAKRWAKGRSGVHVLSTDDRYHAGSSLILIEHKNELEFMGVTVVYIPQCAPDEPTEFFLYPCHAKPLYLLLQAQKRWRDDRFIHSKPLPERIKLEKEIYRLFKDQRKAAKVKK